jgi:hypothetical protein
MKELFDFNAQMLNYFMNKVTDGEVSFTHPTGWHDSHPYYRLNYYKQVQISQVTGIYLLFNKDWLSKFDNIVEIGSYNGGLSSYIFDNRKENALFVSYDIDPTINMVTNNQGRTDIDFRIGDCFEESVFNEIAELISKEGKTLLICDGGNKTREFNDFAQYLKKGDIVILHDYADDEVEFKEYTDYWQWPYWIETHFNDIKHTVEEQDLEKFEYSKFNFFLWGSFIKK